MRADRASSWVVLLVLSLAGAPRVGTRPEEIEKPPPPPRITVVVHKDNPVARLSPEELRRLFLRQALVWEGGELVTVLERPFDQAVRRRFSRTVLGKAPEEFREYWLNLKLTRGLTPPKILKSAALIRAYLQRIRGGIAYVEEGEVDDATMKIVARIEAKDGE